MNVTTIHIPFDEDLLPARNLRSGRWTCMYEHGRLRYIKYVEIELIRMVYFAVRDKYWNTPSYTIENESIEAHNNGFTILYTALHTLDEISYRSNVSIIASGDTITFFVKGEALSTFQRNRIGICVLHPINECRGKDVVIEKPDGTEYRSSFPDLISPHQPFKEIKKMHCTIGNGISVDINFEGDVFETEDQRNWADSSYKTYSTPLDISIPVNITEGTTLEQKIEFKFTFENAKNELGKATNQRKIPFPKIGYGIGNNDHLNEEEIKLLGQIPFDHYRVELFLSNPGWEEILEIRLREAIQLKTKLELILFFTEEFHDQLNHFINSIKEHSPQVCSILILQVGHSVTPRAILETVFPAIKKYYANIEVGYGTDGFFADLNRNRPVDSHFDFLSFPLTPQVHASDTRSLIDNLERQKDLIQTARSFAQGKKINVSPITFKMRSSSTGQDGKPIDLDTRQHQSFGALWTLNSIKNLSEADRLTFFQVKGYRGILGDNNFARWPPTFQQLKTIKEFSPKWIIILEDEPGKIVMENENGDRLEFDIEALDVIVSVQLASKN